MDLKSILPFILSFLLQMNETLRELYLADNRLQATDAIQLGNLLKYNYTLRLLDIRNNHVHDVGLAHITDGLREQVIDAYKSCSS